MQKVPQLYTESVKNDNKQIKNIDEHHSITPVHQNYNDDRLTNDQSHNVSALPPEYTGTDQFYQTVHSPTESVNVSNGPLKEHDENDFEKGKFTS